MDGIKNTNSKDELLAIFQDAFSKSKDSFYTTLSTADVCQILGKSRWTVYKIVEDGKLPAYQSEAGKKGSRLVFKKDDVFAYLESTLKPTTIKKEG